jgi:epoxide hydrolase-like predicted phosphatase
MKNITTFIFDCFGVVCDPVLNSWYKDHSAEHGFVDENLLETFKKFDLGIMSEDDMAEYFSKYPGITSTKDQIKAEIDTYTHLDDSLAQIIQKLRVKGFKTVLLSNANHSYFERKIYTQYPEFKSLFDEIIISSLINMVKPDPNIFIHTLERIGATPEESVFIDDNKINVEAAEKLHINGFVYTDSISFARYLQEKGIII